MSRDYGIEIKVGALVFAALVLAGVFLWLLGDYTPLASTYNVYVEYNFAGGVEMGTPVRVSGIKVGKVTSIEFLEPGAKDSSGEEVAIRLRLNVSRKVRKKVRRDSSFYINQAGIIGERYIEITPGSASEPVVEPDSVVRGADPPRFDQLISQSMDLFGEISKIIEENKDSIEKITAAIEQASELLDKLAEKLDPEDYETLIQIIHRIDRITIDAQTLVYQMRQDVRPTLYSVRKTLDEARPMLRRADRLLREFDELTDELRDLPDERKEEIRQTLSDMVEMTQQLQDVIERMDAFTAMVERDFSDLDRAKIEQILREFLQEEGIRIKVGEVKFKDRKPKPE